MSHEGEDEGRASSAPSPKASSGRARPKRAASVKAGKIMSDFIAEELNHGPAGRGGRRRAPARTLNPALLVGYAEDLETPEMIMKKFEALEEFQKSRQAEQQQQQPQQGEGAAGEDAPMSETDLQQVFKITSAFSVAGALATDSGGYGDYMDGDEDEFWDVGGLRQYQDDGGEVTYFVQGSGADENELWGGFWDNAGEEELDDEGRPKKRRKQLHLAGGNKKFRTNTPRSLAIPRPPLATMPHGIAAFHPMKRLRKVNPDAVAIIRVPDDPIPSSWARRILPYSPPEAIHAHTQWTSSSVLMPVPATLSTVPAPGHRAHVCDVLNDSKLLMQLARACGGFQGCVLDPPWREPRPGVVHPTHAFEPEMLALLPLGSPEFLPRGFVYVWTPKHWINRVLVALEKMNLHYVENAIVVYDTVVRGPRVLLPCPVFSQSKDTLLLCRRGKKHPTNGKIEWVNVELRHQRISDVHVTCHRTSEEDKLVGLKPRAYVYKMAETMLPKARYNQDRKDASDAPLNELERGGLIEIWTPLEKSGEVRTRSGWTMVAQEAKKTT